MEATMVATEATTMARGPLRLRLSPPPLLSPLLMPSPDILVVTDMDTVLTDTEAMAMEATEDTTMARGLLMLSPDTDTTAMGTEATVEDTMVMVMVTGTDTMVEKFQKFMLIQSD